MLLYWGYIGIVETVAVLIVASTTRQHELAAKRGLVMDLWSAGESSAVQELATAALCT